MLMGSTGADCGRRVGAALWSICSSNHEAGLPPSQVSCQTSQSRKYHCLICPFFRHMPKMTKRSCSESMLLKYFWHIPSDENMDLLRQGNCNTGPSFISPNRRDLVYLGAEETDSMSRGLYHFGLLFLFQVHKKNESQLIKIKWSERTSYFPLHLWSVCFQIYSAGSIFFPLGWHWSSSNPLRCQTYRSKQHLPKDSHLFDVRGFAFLHL